MRKILLVEDEEVLRSSYALILSTEPYDVDIAVNGQDALDKCVQKTYDLILLDLMMPVVDGVEFLERFNPKDKEHEQTKIIILSNLSSGEELTRALKLGAHDNVLKAQLSPRQFLSMIRYELEAV